MCVASYGVMPQTYSRAGPSGVVVTREPVAVSWMATAGPLNGREGISGDGHVRMREA
jgi:hypothetical protein